MKFGAALVAFATLLITPTAYAPAAVGPSVVAASRCSARMIGDYASEIRDDDAHPPGSDLRDLQKRFNDLNELLQALSQERAVLDSVCSSDADKAPLFAYLSATASYALALQSDVALKIDLPCAAAAKAVAAALVAQGWLDLASIVNDAGGTVPKDVAQAAPRIQKRAAALDLALPVYKDTSAYWRDQQSGQAKTAVEACSTPAPSASPSP